MQISRENTDELNAVITLKITEEDYSLKVDNVLKDYKRKARIDGFRPGMVPMGMIKKLYYKSVLAEEVIKLANEKLYDYIRDEKMRILGEPLPHNDEKPEIDFDKDKEFEFSFDIGLYPEISLDISDKNEIPLYTIRLEDDAIKNAVEEISNTYGKSEEEDKISDSEATISGNIFQSDDSGNPVEGGISAGDVYLFLNIIKDNDTLELFKEKKTGEKVSFKIRSVFPEDDKIKNFLKIENDEITDFGEFYTIEIKEIKVFKKHEINQELFDKVYGEGQVKSEEEFTGKIKEELINRYKQESEYRFTVDARDYYLKKLDFALPVEFLKRWLVETQENISKEELEKNFGDYENDFKWQIIKDQIIKAKDIQVSEQEMLDFAILSTRGQFYQYGMYNIPEEYIEKYAREQLAKADSSKQLLDQKLSQKVFEFIRETVTIKENEVSREEFNKLYEN